MNRTLALCLMALAAGAAQAADDDGGGAPDEPAAAPSAPAPTSSMAAVVDRGVLLAQGAKPRSPQLTLDLQMQPLDPGASRAVAQQVPQGWAQTGHPAHGNNAGQALRTRLWVQRGGLGLGAGADAALVGSNDSARPVVAMRADVMPNTRVWVEQLGRPMVGPPSPLAPMPGLADTTVTRVGLDFKSPSKSSTLPLGVFRFQVSSGSTLMVRPRSGGVAMSYRSVF